MSMFSRYLFIIAMSLCAYQSCIPMQLSRVAIRPKAPKTTQLTKIKTKTPRMRTPRAPISPTPIVSTRVETYSTTRPTPTETNIPELKETHAIPLATKIPETKHKWSDRLSEWFKSFTKPTSNTSYTALFTQTLRNWFSTKASKIDSNTTFTKAFTVSEITPKALWGFYDRVLTKPFKYNDFMFESQLEPLQKIINYERDGKTILGATLRQFLSIRPYETDINGRQNAYNTFVKRHTEHGDAILTYCNKMIEMGGTLGVKSEDKLADLLLDIEALKIFFEGSQLVVNDTTMTINQMVKPFENILKTIAYEQKINFEKIQNDVQTNAIDTLYWNKINSLLAGQTVYGYMQIAKLLNFYPSLINIKNTHTGNTALDTIFEMVFQTKDIDQLLRGKIEDRMVTSYAYNLSSSTLYDILGFKALGFGAMNSALEDIINLGATFSKNTEEKIVKFYVCAFVFENIEHEGWEHREPIIKDYAAMLKELLNKFCAKHKLDWVNLYNLGQEQFNKAWTAKQNRDSQQKSRKEKTHRSQKEDIPTDVLERAYKTLELQINAPFEEIKKRRLELVNKYHPDKNVGASSEQAKENLLKTQRVNAAYDIIKASQPSNL